MISPRKYLSPKPLGTDRKPPAESLSLRCSGAAMNSFHFMVALIEYWTETHNSEAHPSQPLPRAQIELMSLQKKKKSPTMETRRPNLIFGGGFGMERHRFWVPLLCRLFHQPVDEAVAGVLASW